MSTRKWRTRRGRRLTLQPVPPATSRDCNFCGTEGIPDDQATRWWGLTKDIPLAFSCSGCTPRVVAKVESLSNTRRLSICMGQVVNIEFTSRPIQSYGSGDDIEPYNGEITAHGENETGIPRGTLVHILRRTMNVYNSDETGATVRLPDGDTLDLHVKSVRYLDA